MKVVFMLEISKKDWKLLNDTVNDEVYIDVNFVNEEDMELPF